MKYICELYAFGENSACLSSQVSLEISGSACVLHLNVLEKQAWILTRKEIKGQLRLKEMCGTENSNFEVWFTTFSGGFAMNHFKRRRKVIKKLDFENCEVTTVRIKKGYSKRLKATMISEYEDEAEPSSDSKGNSQSSFHPEDADTRNSPVLFRKGSTQRRLPETVSPVLIRKQKSVQTKRLKMEDESPSSCSKAKEISITSPIFKFKCISKTEKIQSSEMCERYKSKSSCDIVTDEDHSADEYVIEDFSQELSRESNAECGKPNFSLESEVCSQVNVEDQSRKPFSTEDEPFVFKTPTKEYMEIGDELNSEKKTKRPKKGGLVERLLNLRRQQESERRIREHKKIIMKTEEVRKRNFYVVEAWNDGKLLTLKCQQIEVSQAGTATAIDFRYILLSRDVRNCFKKIKRGTFIRIAAPWQEVQLNSLNITVLLSVNFIELIDAVPGINPPKILLKEISVGKYKEDEALFFDTIFASDENVFHT